MRRIVPVASRPRAVGGSAGAPGPAPAADARVTGAGGALDTAPRRYRLLAFDGCRTSDYERALRGTSGYDSAGADVIETSRTVSGSAEAPTFMAFLDSVLAQRSGERLVGGMNAAMRAGEPEFCGNPFGMTCLGDNPGH